MRDVLRVPVPMLFAVAVVTCACGDEAARRGATVMFASGADLQSINPLLTNHMLRFRGCKILFPDTLTNLIYRSDLAPVRELRRIRSAVC